MDAKPQEPGTSPSMTKSNIEGQVPVNTTNKKYHDDLTYFLAWQNWYLTQYLHLNTFFVTNNIMRSLQFSTLASQTETAAGGMMHGQSYLISQGNYQPGVHHQSTPVPPNQSFPQRQPPRQPETGQRAIEASLAPLHRRIAAELIDSLLLLLGKLLFVTVLYGDKYVEKFQYILIVDEKTTIQDLETMLMQALLFRAFVILYETVCLSGTIIRQSQGMTLGKKLLKLRVVKCEVVEVVDRVNSRVRVIPGTVLGFWSSLLRAILKSFIVSVLFPMLIPLNFVAFHNRLIYDLISGSIVLQDVEVAR